MGRGQQSCRADTALLNDGIHNITNPITISNPPLHSIPSKPPEFVQSAGPKSKTLNLHKDLDSPPGLVLIVEFVGKKNTTTQP